MNKVFSLTVKIIATTVLTVCVFGLIFMLFFAFTFCSSYDRNDTIAIAAENLKEPYQVHWYDGGVGERDGYYYYSYTKGHQIHIKRRKGCSMEVQTIFHEFAHAEQYENTALAQNINNNYPDLPKEARADAMGYSQMLKHGYSWCAFNLLIRHALGLRQGEYRATNALRDIFTKTW